MKAIHNKCGTQLVYRLLLGTLLAVSSVACGKVSGNEDQAKVSNASGVVSPDDPSLQAAATPPVYVSHTLIDPTQIELTLSKELTDATATNPSNFLFNNGLQASSVTKKAGSPSTLVINTTVQQQISYVLTLINLTSIDGGVLSGVIQISFTGLPSPNIILVDWRNPATTLAFPATLGSISLCVPSQVSGATCTNAPYYNKTDVYGILNAPNAVAYKYRVDAGSWSAAIPIGTPLNITGLSDGLHTFYIIGQHAAGYWQSATASDVYVKSWVQDATPPTAILDPLTLPASTTASQTLSVRAVGTDVSYFRYCIDNAAITDCTASTFNGSPDSAAGMLSIPNAVYTANLTPGNVTVKVIGYDSSGNAQASPVSGGSYTYLIDTGSVEAVFSLATLPSSVNNGTSTAAVSVLGTFGAVQYRGKIVSGTNCNSGTTWNLLPDTPIATQITASGLTSGQYTVCAIGKSVGGYWQGGYDGVSTNVSIVTKYTWIIDTTPPTTVINWNSPITQPTTTTQTSGYDLQISTNDGATQYRYAVVTGAGTPCTSGTYSGNVAIDTGLTLNPPTIATTGVTTYKICVIGTDAAGNVQTTATATPEWTVDVDPPANNPAFAAVSQVSQSFNTAVLTFSIDNSTATADSFYYRVQVATDTGFTNIIGDAIIKSCKTISLPDCPAALGTRTYTIAVDAFASPSSYARVQAGDSLGNYRTDYSTTSGEHYVVGKITGFIKNQAGAAVPGIALKLLTTGGTDVTASYPAETFVTDALGQFTFNSIRTAKLGYQIRAAEGDATYYPATKRNITVQEKGGGIQTNIGVLSVVAIAGSSAQTVSAKVVDADDGWMLGYAEVKLIDYAGATVATTRTLSTAVDCPTLTPVGSPPTNIPKAKFDVAGATCGDFSFASVAPGTYTIQVTGNSWGSSNQIYNRLDAENIVVSASTASAGRLPLVRVLAGQDVKIVLSWGALEPRDPDLHVVGTVPTGKTVTNVNGDNCNTNQFHIWAGRPNVGGFAWQQQYSAKTGTYIQSAPAYNAQNYFPLDPSTTAALVQDANSGYGPEAVNLISGYTDGTYWVSVINWGGWYPGAYGVTKASQRWDVTQVGFKVYDADGLAFEMNAAQPATTPSQLGAIPPVAGCGLGGAADWNECELWQAFKITVSGGGSAGRKYTPVNTYQNWVDSSGASVNDLNKCFLNTF